MPSLQLLLDATCLMALKTGAFASDADLRLNNITGYQIDEVYVAPHSRRGKDIMGSDALADGEGVNITFAHGGSACHFDIKVKYNVNDRRPSGATSISASITRFPCSGTPRTRFPGLSTRTRVRPDGVGPPTPRLPEYR